MWKRIQCFEDKRDRHDWLQQAFFNLDDGLININQVWVLYSSQHQRQTGIKEKLLRIYLYSYVIDEAVCKTQRPQCAFVEREKKVDWIENERRCYNEKDFGIFVNQPNDDFCRLQY